LSQIEDIKQAMMNEDSFMFMEVSGVKQLLAECGSEEAAGWLLADLVRLTNNPVMLIEPHGVTEDGIAATFFCPKGWLPSHCERFFENVVDLALIRLGLTTLGYTVWYNGIGEGIETFQVRLGGPGVDHQRAQL
jgi:hypothetical protein